MSKSTASAIAFLAYLLRKQKMAQVANIITSEAGCPLYLLYESLPGSFTPSLKIKTTRSHY
jgi:hypothetical protein